MFSSFQLLPYTHVKQRWKRGSLNQLLCAEGITGTSVCISTMLNASQLFSLNKGDEFISSTLPSPTGTVFWSVVRSSADKTIIIKVCTTYSLVNIALF